MKIQSDRIDPVGMTSLKKVPSFITCGFCMFGGLADKQNVPRILSVYESKWANANLM